MTIARHYVMTAAAGQESALETALLDAADLIRAVPGSEGVEVQRDQDNAGRFFFIEKWTSIEAHKAAPGQLPKGGLDAVTAALAGPPEGLYLDCLKAI